MTAEASLRKPRILLVGFPKSGTSSINEALHQSGLRTAHWNHQGRAIAQLIYDGWYDHGDPFALLTGLDAITQADFCYNEDWLKAPITNGVLNKTLRKLKKKVTDEERQNGPIKSLWPQLDIALLLAIRNRYPDCKFILNYRDPSKVASSMMRWKDFGARLSRVGAFGLPAEKATSPRSLETWIETHYAAIRTVFKDDPNFFEIDIEAVDVPEKLGHFLGMTIKEWGHHNQNLENPKLNS